MAEEQDLLDALPEELRRKLKRARHCYRRGMRAPLGSNQREACMEEFHAYIREATDEAAGEGIPVDRLPKWAIEHFREEPATQ